MAQSSTTLQQVSLSSSLTSSPFASTHLDHTLLNATTNGGGYESNIYSLAPDLTSSLGNAGTDPGSQKITLLTRNHPTNSVPAQPPLSSSPLGSRLDDSVLSRMASTVHSTSILASADSSPLSRQRNYYFDTEDPSVNLHDFIINSLQSPKNRVILLQLEEEFLKYISDPNRTEPLKLPSWDSYHRMLAHRVAAYFGLEHNVDPQDKTRVVVAKGPSTRMPQQRFSDHIPVTVYEEPDINEPKSILKRIRASSGSEKFDGLTSNPAAEIKSFEEREEEYEKARARIFSQSSTQLHETDPADIPFDLFSSSPFGRSALRTPLHHRRTFSDTAFINKLFSQKESKQGPSSSGNSPCSTPAFFPPSPPSLSASSSSNAVGVINQTSVTPEDVSQHSSRQHQKRTMTTRPPPPTFIPFYSSAPPAIPVMYHPQPVIDPNWYYNHMLVYPVAPQAGYQIPHFVQSPVVPHYSLPQHPGIISAPTARVNSLGIRIPSTIMTDHVGSPTHPVYPSLPQQTSATQLKSEDYSSGGTVNPLWSPQGIPVPTMYSSQQQSSSNPQYVHNMVPQLADQMEKSLSLTEGNMTDASDPDKMGMSPIGQQHQAMYGRSYTARGQMNMYGYPHTGVVDPVVVSPTTLVPPSQFIHGPPEHIQGSLPPPNNISFLSNLPLHGREQPHPATPTLPPGVIQPSGPSIQSPVQILGHSLSTSIFSPPPSAGPPGLFMNPTGSGKPNSPGHSAVGSGVRFQRYDSPQQSRPDLALQTQQVMHDSAQQSYKNSMVSLDSSGVPQPLPPRLAQRGSGTRYQNQRHPSNRLATKPEQQDQQQYTNNTRYPPRKEPLLPTPSEMIKLDTGITAGVPVHIMEVLHPPSEESSDSQQLLSKLQDHGALEFKRGWMNRNTEIMVAIFDNSDTALQALKQCVLPPPAKLSIPLPTHAKHILQLL